MFPGIFIFTVMKKQNLRSMAAQAEVPGHLWARWYDRLLALGADLPPRPEQ